MKPLEKQPLEQQQSGMPNLEGPKLNSFQLLQLLVKYITSLPDGQHRFRLDVESQELTLLSEDESEEISDGTIGVLREGNNFYLICLAESRSFNSTYQDSLLELAIGENDSLVSFEWLLTDRNQRLVVRSDYKNDEPTTEGWLYFPLVPMLSSLSLFYSNNDSNGLDKLHFNGINELQPHQVALLLKGEDKLEFSIEQLIVKWLNNGSRDAVKAMPKPVLTFHPNKYTYNAVHSRVYLACTESSPALELGSVISGIAITETGEKPYRIEVRLDQLKEHDYEYAHGLGNAVEITAQVTVSDGLTDLKVQQLTFTVFANLDNIVKNPQRIPAAAFVAFNNLTY